MWRRILISLLVVLMVGGTYVWFSLSPGEQVNLEAAADMTVLAERLHMAQETQLPVSFSGNEVKTLAVQAIKSAGIDDRIKGIDVQLGQSDMAISLAVDVGAKVLAVTAVARPALSDDQLTIDLSGTKIGVVPVPVSELLERLDGRLPTGVALTEDGLSIDLQLLDSWGLDSLRVENGRLQVQPK